MLVFLLLSLLWLTFTRFDTLLIATHLPLLQSTILQSLPWQHSLVSLNVFSSSIDPLPYCLRLSPAFSQLLSKPSRSPFISLSTQINIVLFLLRVQTQAGSRSDRGVCL